MKKHLIFICALSAILAQSAYSAADSIIVDNEGNGFASTGKWNKSTRDKPFHGNGYVWSPNSSSSTAVWTPTLTSEGIYEVSVWFCASMDKDRADNAKYIINHGGGKEEITLSQKPSAKLNNKWHKLGEFSFSPQDAEDKRNVTLNNTGATHSVSADAMMWVLKEIKTGNFDIPKKAAEFKASMPQIYLSPWENGFVFSWSPEYRPQEIKLYSSPSGKLIKSWYQPNKEIRWKGELSNGKSAPNGVYIVRTETAGFSTSDRLIVKE